MTPILAAMASGLAVLIDITVSVAVFVPWSWSRGASRPALAGAGVGLGLGMKSWFLNCVFKYGLYQTACWRSQCLLTNVQTWRHTAGVVTRYSLHSVFTYLLYLCRQRKCRVVGASLIKQTVPATCMCYFLNLSLRRADFQQQWSRRPHRARTSDHLLSQLVFLVDCDWT